MLNIINDLEPFFEDCYERINVRKYAKILGISPPTASKILNNYEHEGLLEKTIYERYNFYSANRNSKDFIDLSRIYWRKSLSRLIEFILKERAVEPTVVLFGSLSKAETKKTSDIDLAVVGNDINKLVSEDKLSDFQKELGREIELFTFASLEEAIKLPIGNAILNGYILANRL